QLQVIDERGARHRRRRQRPARRAAATRIRGHGADHQNHDDDDGGRGAIHGREMPTSIAAARSGSRCGSGSATEKIARNVRTFAESALVVAIGDSCSSLPWNARDGYESSVIVAAWPTNMRSISA